MSKEKSSPLNIPARTVSCLWCSISIETLLSRWIVSRKSLHLYGFFRWGHDFDQLFDSELRVSYLYLCLYLYLYLPAPKSWASFVLISAALVYLSLGRAHTCKISELASDSFVDWLCTEEDFSFLAKRRALFNWICKQVFFFYFIQSHFNGPHSKKIPLLVTRKWLKWDCERIWLGNSEPSWPAHGVL